MPSFSKTSLERLATCDRRLYDICSEAIKNIDFTVICGHRTQEEQDKAVAKGKSKTPWPTSKHNSSPSQAVDLATYPIDWNDLDKFRELNLHIQTAADKLGIKIRWGGDWNGNKIEDQSFYDYDHWELA